MLTGLQLTSATQKQLSALYEDIVALLQHMGKIMASLPKTCAAGTENPMQLRADPCQPRSPHSILRCRLCRAGASTLLIHSR